MMRMTRKHRRRNNMPNEVSTGVQKFGLPNIITIGIVLATALFNYAQMDARLSTVEKALASEIVDRRVADEKIQIAADAFYERNDTAHVQMLAGIVQIQKDLTFHLGIHQGQEEAASQKDK
jgi:isocitrate dehydrogenase kinase/phosphatase